MTGEQTFAASEVHNESQGDSPGPAQGRERIQDPNATKMRGKHPSEPAEGPDRKRSTSTSRPTPLAEDPHGAHPDDPAEGSPDIP